MSSHTTTERNRYELLQMEYRHAWHNFTVAVELLQFTISDASKDEESLVDARSRVEKAVAKYRDARNALADCLLSDVNNEGSSSDESRLPLFLTRSQAA